MKFKQFALCESGAITTDWVFISAGIVAMGMATTAVVTAGTENISRDIAQATANDTLGHAMSNWTQGTEGSAGSGGGFGSLSLLHWSSEVELVDRVASMLSSRYNGSHQAYYDTAMGNINAGRFVAEEIDVIGAVTASAEAAGVTIDTGTNQSYAELHAAYLAGSL